LNYTRFYQAHCTTLTPNDTIAVAHKAPPL